MTAAIHHDFQARDFVGGNPVIDFVNTVTARNSVPLDWLDGHPALLRWAAMSGLPAFGEGGPSGEAELQLCKELREALHTILASVIDRHSVPREATQVLQANWREAYTHARLDASTRASSILQVRRDPDSSEVGAVRWALTVAAVDLVTSELPGERLRRCPGEHCGWLFLDSSKAGRRRWCDMATCGTADKNRRRRIQVSAD